MARRVVQLGWLAVAALHAAGVGLAQSASPQSATPNGVIVGVVVDQTTGKPIPDATVTLTLGLLGAVTANVPQRVMTDPLGRFAFAGLPAAAGLVIQATKAGYAAPSALNVDLHDGERITNGVIRLTQYGSINGRVIDDLGDPVVGVTVRAHRRRYEGGHPHFPYGTPARTDDRGMYRIAFLEPGDYIVAVPTTQISLPVPVMRDWMTGNAGNIGGAMIDVTGMTTFSSIDGAQRIGNSVLQSPIGTYYPPDSGDPTRGTAYQTTFAPSTSTTSTATVVALQLGEQRTGVDVQLTLVPTVSVSGTVVGPDGPAALAALRLMTPSSEFPDTANYAAATAMSDAAGAFTFLNVPAGTYMLRATRRATRDSGLPESYKLWGEETLTVGDKPIDGVRVTLRKPFVVSGRVEFEGTTLPAAVEMARLKGDQTLLFLMGVDERSGGAFARDDPNGSFTTDPVAAGRYIVVSTIRSPRWSLKSAMWQGKDLTRTPIDLKENVSGVVATFTERPGRIAGTVRDSQGVPDRSATVLLFPADASAWMDYGDFPRQMLRAGPSTSGTYNFPRVPAGDYFLVAVVESPTASTALDVPSSLRDWLNPAFLRAVSGAAVRVHVTDGEAQTMDLKTTSIR